MEKDTPGCFLAPDSETCGLQDSPFPWLCRQQAAAGGGSLRESSGQGLDPARRPLVSFPDPQELRFRAGGDQEGSGAWHFGAQGPTLEGAIFSVGFLQRLRGRSLSEAPGGSRSDRGWESLRARAN